MPLRFSLLTGFPLSRAPMSSYVLDHGMIVQSGSQADLVAAGGLLPRYVAPAGKRGWRIAPRILIMDVRCSAASGDGAAGLHGAVRNDRPGIGESPEGLNFLLLFCVADGPSTSSRTVTRGLCASCS